MFRRGRQGASQVGGPQGGKVAEQGTRDAILRSPQDPYTRRLIQAAPVPDPDEQAVRRSERLAARAG